MKQKQNLRKGFTLAELLIVVAIIAVLVAISIPIFTTQLEKSREATDLANVRAAYTEVMTAAITADTSAVYSQNSSMKIYQNGDYTITVQPLKQRRNDWQTQLPITIGGVSSSAGNPYWIGVPAANGYCKITYHTAEDYVSFEWSGTPDSSDSDIPSDPDTPSDSENPSTPSGKVPIIDYPDKPTDGSSFQVYQGYVYRKNNKIYIASTTPDKQMDQYYYVDPEDRKLGAWLFVEPTGTVFTPKDEVPNKNEQEDLNQAINIGDIYIDSTGQKYLCLIFSNPGQSPKYDKDESHWIKIVGDY